MTRFLRRQKWKIASAAVFVSAVYVEQSLHLYQWGGHGWWQSLILFAATLMVASFPHLLGESLQYYKGLPRELKPKFAELDQSDVRIPHQINSVFVDTVKEAVNHTLALTRQEPVRDVSLYTQYQYASGVAGHYRRQRVPFIRATALDLPSTFINDHFDYFEIQEHLATDRNHFVAYAHQERWNLSKLTKWTKNDPLPTMERQPGATPEKARIAVIERGLLPAELAKEKFWAFVNWHATHDFGLKFLLRKSAEDKEYENALVQTVGTPKDRTIYDYIVYGDECVFGRINTKPNEQRRVTLGFHYAVDEWTAIVTEYGSFFGYLWADDVKGFPMTHTLTELWELPDIQPALAEHIPELDELMKAYGEAVKQRP
jgi:hypothetical protein